MFKELIDSCIHTEQSFTERR